MTKPYVGQIIESNGLVSVVTSVVPILTKGSPGGKVVEVKVVGWCIGTRRYPSFVFDHTA